MPVFGCVADDFTGAGDAASFLVKGGMSVQLFNGIPQEESRIGGGVQAVVIALKSRTQKREDAVADTIAALRWLKEKGVQQFYLKYCSTFDSTPEGNIGPIADAAMEFLQVPCTVLCPALPVNGRVVKHGELYVNGVPLQESPMKHHPLTPMWDCRIARLMEPQSKYPCVELWKEQMEELAHQKHRAQGDSAVWDTLRSGLPKQDASKQDAPESPHCYIIPDYQDEQDGSRIVELFGGLTLLTGGSGILEALAERWSGQQEPQNVPDVRTGGQAILLAGSCSKATLGQIAHFKAHGGLSYKLDPAAMLAGSETVEDAWRFVKENWGSPVLVYSSDTAQNVKAVQQFGQERIAAMLEQAAAQLAQRAVAHGARRVIVAGGETSGAVTKRLGFSSYRIGASAAPGVPVMIPMETPDIRLVLKSGNFGQEDFFMRVLRMTELVDRELEKKLQQAVWIGKSLFDRNRTTGSSANMSFCHNGKIYISRSGSCFGTLTPGDFAVMELDGTCLSECKPSKEAPLHLQIYRKKPETGAVIHTHGSYAVLWSFVPAEDETDVIPKHTPYLDMKLGTVGMVPYEKPGSQALFDAFGERVMKSNGYLLKQHGAVVPGKDLMDAFYCIEELEESAKIAWMLKGAAL